MDAIEWFIIGAIVFIIAMIPVTIYNMNKYENACHARGGRVIHTRGGMYCVKPDTLIDVN
jgi:hypothetical protein